MAALFPIIDRPDAWVLFLLGVSGAVAAAVAAGRAVGWAAGLLAAALALGGLAAGTQFVGCALLAALFLHYAATVAIKACALARYRGARLPPGRLVGYLLIWPGLDAGIAGTRDPGGRRSDAFAGMALGAAGVVGAIALGRVAAAMGVPEWPTYPRAWIRGIGFVFLLEGWMVFAVNAARALGYRCEDAFRAPLRSASLAEFWGKRWNLFVSRFLHMTVFRPFARRLGTGVALVLAFVASGLLHEVLWGLPGRAGSGAFLMFFTLNAIAILALEVVLPGRGETDSGRRIRRAACWGVLLATAPFFVGRAYQAILPLDQ